MDVWIELKKPRHFAIPDAHTLHEFLHRMDHWVHRSYLLLVSIEVHYWYGKIAMVMLVLEVVSIFMQEGQE